MSSTMSIASAPRLVWDTYVEYLWNYGSDSWVGRAASFFRVLAVILVLPVVLLTLLDVSSYVIARTLGIVDDVKASTSDTNSPRSVSVPVSVDATLTLSPSENLKGHEREMMQSGSVVDSEDLVPEDSTHGRLSESQFQTQMQTQTPNQTDIQGRSDSSSQSPSESAHSWTLVASQSPGSHLRPPEMYYFTGEEDLWLAGVGEFSPDASTPPSPLLPRRELGTLDSDSTEDEGIVLRRRLQGARQGE